MQRVPAGVLLLPVTPLRTCVYLGLPTNAMKPLDSEYAIGTIAAAAFGAVLYGVVTGDNIVSGLTDIIGKALGTSTG